MKLVMFVLIAAFAGLAPANALLEFRNDLSFDAKAVDAMAERAYRQQIAKLASTERLDRDQKLLARLNQIVAKLHASALIEDPRAATVQWEIHTCRACDENASAMAGGKLLIGEEFVAKHAFTQDELGYVLAHEMAHVLAEHSRETATGARFFVSNGKNRRYEDIQNELNESFIVNLQMSFLAEHQELEADYMGLVIGARSGFKPKAMLTLLEKLKPTEVSVLALHANHEARVAQVKNALDAAERLGRKSTKPR